IIGGGPAGLMAAETARAAGVAVQLFDRMGSVGRKFLIAGKGGLNLTHSDAFDAFVARYGARANAVRAWLEAFDAEALRIWARGGGSWPVLGSDGSWVDILAARGVELAPLQPSNCGFDIAGPGPGGGWSEHFAKRHAGDPVKPVMIEWDDPARGSVRKQGEFV